MREDLKQAWLRLRAIAGRRRLERDLDDELRFHLEMRAAKNLQAGMSADEARRSAGRRFGNCGVIRDECRDAWTFASVEALSQDLRFAVRSLAKNAWMASAVVLALALGIGANTAIYSAIDTALFRPFAVPEPDQLSALFSVDKKTGRYLSSSYPDYLDFSQRNQSFEQLAAYVRFPLTVAFSDQSESLPIECVTSSYFPMLRLSPLLGRLLDQSDASQLTAVISERMWRQRLQADPHILGSALTIEDQSFTIVGVAPGSFRGTNLNWHEPPDIWIPLDASYSVIPRLGRLDILNQRAMQWLVLIGRRKPGVNSAQAETEIQAIAADIARDAPESNRGISVVSFPLSYAKFWPSYRETVQRTLAAFAAAGALLLLLACANVSNLLLERGLSRRRELAVRIALGVSRARLAQLLLIENFVLLAHSFLAALGVAYGLQRVLPHFPAALGLSLALDLRIDGRVLAIAALITLAATILFAFAPLLQVRHGAPVESLKQSGNSSMRRIGALRQSLVVLQVAFAMILLVCGAVVGRSLLGAYATDFGFQPRRLLAVNSTSRQHGPMLATREALAQIAALPGVQSAAAARSIPLGGPHRSLTVHVPARGGAPLNIKYNSIGPDYLRTLGIDLIGGREFSQSDIESSARVAVVSQSLALDLFPQADPLGQTILVDQANEQNAAYEVIGVAGDSKYESVWEQSTPYLYLPYSGTQSNFVISTLVTPLSMEPLIRTQLQALDPRAVIQFTTGDDLLNSALAPQRLTTALLGTFAALAILLGSIGVGSVLSYFVQRSTREIGVRLAIGAEPNRMLRWIIAKALALAGIGVAIGGIAAFAATPNLVFLAKDVDPRDMLPFAAVACLILAVSIAASLGPAIRAARIDPALALRKD
jgi:predicted permease